MDKNEIRAENISLICLLRTLKKNLWMIAAAAAIFAMLVSLYADFIRKPVYRASMTYAVTSRMSGYSTRNITAAKELASILTEVLDNRIVNDTIRASSEELRGYSGGIKAKLVENSNFVVVTSESGSQREAFLALVALRDNFDTISDYISSNIVAQVIQEPRVSSSPVNSMNVRRTAMKAALIGAVLMAAAIVAISVMSETVQTRSGAKSLIDAPVIAMLGHEKGARKKKRRGAGAILINSPAVSLAYTEQINSLCSRIEHEKREKGGGIVLVTSVGANEGKSTVAANIAISLASRGYKVALIDADLRNPSHDGAVRRALEQSAAVQQDACKAVLRRGAEHLRQVRRGYERHDALLAVQRRALHGASFVGDDAPQHRAPAQARLCRDRYAANGHVP